MGSGWNRLRMWAAAGTGFNGAESSGSNKTNQNIPKHFLYVVINCN
jgi:hypothetical protein